MAEVKALQRQSCPECGGDAQWNPAKQALICPYCGAIVPGQLKSDGAGIEEHDLAEALRRTAPEQRGWRAEKISVKCQSCRAISIFDPGRAAQRCDFCGSPAIAPYEETKDPIRPESVLPFKLSEDQVRDQLRTWYGSRWFAPNRLKKAALTDTLKGIYIPYWTFDAKAQAQWNAESGYYYYEDESYRDDNGRTETRRVQKIRWQPSAGKVEHFFDDTLICGSVGVEKELIQEVESYPTTTDLKPYDANFLRGWVVERYQVDLSQAADRSREIMEGEMEALCASDVPGDTHRNLQVETQYLARTFKHILAPIWLVSYTFGASNFQVIVNGYTGKLAGKHPISWVKVALAVVGALIAIGLVLILLQGH